MFGRHEDGSLNPEAVRLFHDTITKQLAMTYDRGDQDSCMAGLFTRSTGELYEMGRCHLKNTLKPENLVGLYH